MKPRIQIRFTARGFFKVTTENGAFNSKKKKKKKRKKERKERKEEKKRKKPGSIFNLRL